MSRKTFAAALAVALAASLTLSGCGNARGSKSAADSAGPVASSREREPQGDEPSSQPEPGSYLVSPGAQPTVAPPPGGSSQSGVISIDPSARPTLAAPPTPWSPPEVKFYMEDASVWFYDQSVVNVEAVSKQGNIEGYRTYDGQCLGYVTRDIEEKTHNSILGDRPLSSVLATANEAKVSNLSNTPERSVEAVRDAGGTMEGFWVSYSGVFTYHDGTQENVEGYRFARVVTSAGLKFSVQIMCRQGANISQDQWLTILKGIRLEGITAGKMS
ncbi:hypothetical protein [Actinomyces bovis]|nr:hypothetical protein [Actinomyces bovis]VEG53314.1 Uncharacterised protein [Actinomyces israelii]